MKLTSKRKSARQFAYWLNAAIEWRQTFQKAKRDADEYLVGMAKKHMRWSALEAIKYLRMV